MAQTHFSFVYRCSTNGLLATYNVQCPEGTTAIFNLVYSDMEGATCLGRCDFMINAHCYLPSNKLITAGALPTLVLTGGCLDHLRAVEMVLMQHYNFTVSFCKKHWC